LPTLLLPTGKHPADGLGTVEAGTVGLAELSRTDGRELRAAAAGTSTTFPLPGELLDAG
jgi:hypothetical protein